MIFAHSEEVNIETRCTGCRLLIYVTPARDLVQVLKPNANITIFTTFNLIEYNSRIFKFHMKND